MSTFYRNILVPVDGSKEAKAALNRAISMAKEAGADARLVIANVIDPRAIRNVTAFDNSMVDTVTEEAKKLLTAYKEQAENEGVEVVDYRIDYGSPKSLIANDIPKEINADLIVIGATGLNTVERIVVGSVTSYVTRVAPVDVLVVKGKED
ncbi:universal stress protein [Fructobacillus sp. M2-14]|uniref:Universal stress protein n=1 Tax=Fructobacillus broussonetiae TaxID=2713173 RepID=A0ABS5R2R5_9LACO|nr:universal stress protein [Fructobacillus broussonetiae]MBS9338956.1 universal stress protein [Fructobacillus broussonetiae]